MSMLVVEGSSGQDEVLDLWELLLIDSWKRHYFDGLNILSQNWLLCTFESLLWSLARPGSDGLPDDPVEDLWPAGECCSCCCWTWAGWDDFDQSLQSCWKKRRINFFFNFEFVSCNFYILYFFLLIFPLYLLFQGMFYLLFTKYYSLLSNKSNICQKSIYVNKITNFSWFSFSKRVCFLRPL